MNQNNSTELLGYSFLRIYNENGPQTPQTQNPDLSLILPGTRSSQGEWLARAPRTSSEPRRERRDRISLHGALWQEPKRGTDRTDGGRDTDIQCALSPGSTRRGKMISLPCLFDHIISLDFILFHLHSFSFIDFITYSIGHPSELLYLVNVYHNEI